MSSFQIVKGDYSVFQRLLTYKINDNCVCHPSEKCRIFSISAGVAELVDAHDSKSCSARSVGSSPTTGTYSKARIRLTYSGFYFNCHVYLSNSNPKL